MKKQILLTIFLLASFYTSPVFTQETARNKEKIISDFKEIKNKLFSSVENQCVMLGKDNVEGIPVSFVVDKLDIRNVLSFANPFSCNLIVDESIKQTHITANIKNVSWNIALGIILETERLVMQAEGSSFRIVKKTSDSDSSIIVRQKTEIQLSEGSFSTEFMQLKNLQLRTVGEKLNGDVVVSVFDENGEKFVKLVESLLSRRGSIEFDSRKNILLISDEKSRLKLVSDFVRVLDQSGFNLEELVNEPNLEIK